MDIKTLLSESTIIAVVGISDKPERDSYMVAEYLRHRGYTIIPVNPMIKEWNGIAAYPDLKSIPSRVHVDIVDVFRKSEALPAIVEEMLSLAHKPKILWMQLGVEHHEAAQEARNAGIFVVENKCIKIEHQR